METRDCSTCGQQQLFELPDCPDGHGRDCPDLACVQCGTAVVVGPVPGWRGDRVPARVRAASAASAA